MISIQITNKKSTKNDASQGGRRIEFASDNVTIVSVDKEAFS